MSPSMKTAVSGLWRTKAAMRVSALLVQFFRRLAFELEQIAAVAGHAHHDRILRRLDAARIGLRSLTSTPSCNSGAVTMKMISNTSITSM